MSDADLQDDALRAQLAQIWQWLCEGAARAGDPFHLASLATLDGDEPDVRTVVLREVDPHRRRLIFHTDSRSPKARQLAQATPVAWLFYDPGLRVQIRARGRAFLHHDDEVAHRRWTGSTLLARRCYLGAPPGSPSDTATSGLPDDLEREAPDPDRSEQGRAHFVVASSEIDRLDWLRLGVAGHRRACFRFDTGHWRGHWAAP